MKVLFKKFNKALIGSVVTFVLLTGIYAIHAEDYSTPHEFKPGDIISADVMNEVMEKIELANSSIQSEDLIGSWNCTVRTQQSFEENPDEALNWSNGNDGLFKFKQVPIDFKNDGDGTFSWTSTGPGIFTIVPEYSGKYFAVDNVLFAGTKTFGQESNVTVPLKKISNTRIFLTIQATSEGPGTPRLATCDKQHLPPAIPVNAVVINTDLIVDISWKDQSTDETGFKIVRKDTLTGEFQEVGSVSANTATFKDTLPGAGTYWYRVKATNANGYSLGSNEVRVILE